MDIELEQRWQKVMEQLTEDLGEKPDLTSVLFLIGVQELGKGYKVFSKGEKVQIMHIAVCKLLESFSYYELAGRDEQGWPHWKLNEKLPPLKPKDAMRILERAGFIRVRTKGSHSIFVRGTHRVTVAYHTKEMRRKTLRSIIEQSGLTAEEFLKLS